MRRALAREAPVALWALALALLVLGPALAPGFLLVRDMVWVPDLALGSDALGLGSALPRAVPSDAVVAVVDEVVPGMLLQKLVLVLALAAGGVGAARLVDRRDGQSGDSTGLAVRLVAVTVYGWNALVAERLLMGAWPILVGYAALPWLLDSARRWRLEGRLPPALLVLVPIGCLSASAGLATAVAVLAGSAGRGRTARAALLVAAGNAPWVVAGLLHAASATSDAAAAEVFALRGEGSVPGPLAALTLGGIWNTSVQPDSRTAILGWVALLALGGLAATGWRSWWRRTSARDRSTLLACWLVGWGLAMLTWLAPGLVGWASEHVPGAGVIRDGARALVLCAPLVAVLVSEGAHVLIRRAPAAPAARLSLAGAAVLLPIALLPDLAYGVARQLEPASYPAGYADARQRLEGRRGDVLVLPLSSYRAPAWNDDRPVLDPLGRYVTGRQVASDVLVVDDVALSGEDPRVAEAADALALPTPRARSAALGAIGIGAVVTDPTAPGGGSEPELEGETVLDAADVQVVVLPMVSQREVPRGWLLAMTAAWLAFLAPLLVALVSRFLVRGSRG